MKEISIRIKEIYITIEFFRPMIIININMSKKFPDYHKSEYFPRLFICLNKLNFFKIIYW